MTKKITDCDLIHDYLLDYKWHNAIDMFKDLKPGCVNWRLGARIHDLRKKGNIIESRIGENGQGEYKLTKKAENCSILTKKASNVKRYVDKSERPKSNHKTPLRFDSDGQGEMFAA